MENATEKFREGRPNFREDIKLFIGLPKQPFVRVVTPRHPWSNGDLEGQLIGKG